MSSRTALSEERALSSGARLHAGSVANHRTAPAIDMPARSLVMTLRNLAPPAPSGKVSPSRRFGQATATGNFMARALGAGVAPGGRPAGGRPQPIAKVRLPQR